MFLVKCSEMLVQPFNTHPAQLVRFVITFILLSEVGLGNRFLPFVKATVSSPEITGNVYSISIFLFPSYGDPPIPWNHQGLSGN